MVSGPGPARMRRPRVSLFLRVTVQALYTMAQHMRQLVKRLPGVGNVFHGEPALLTVVVASTNLDRSNTESAFNGALFQFKSDNLAEGDTKAVMRDETPLYCGNVPVQR